MDPLAFFPNYLPPLTFNQLPPDIILFIFSNTLNDVNTCHETYHSLSLVSSQWKKFSETPLLWKSLFIQAAIPIPNNPAIHLFRNLSFQIGSLFAHNARACENFATEEFNLNIDLSICNKVLFFEDSHLIAFNENRVFISPFENPSDLKTVTFPSKISSSCLLEKIVYCTFANGQIHAFSIDNPDCGIFTIDAHVNEHKGNISIEVLANDTWLISVSKKKIKQWDRKTGTLIKAYDSPDDLCHSTVQIDVNKLYWNTFSIENGRDLHYLDLSDGTSDCIRELENKISNFNAGHNRGAYIIEISPEEMDDSEEESSNNLYKNYIVTFDLSTLKFVYHPIKTAGFSTAPKMIFLKNLAILARDGYNPDKIYSEDMLIEDLDIVEVFDLKTDKYLHSIQKHMIHFTSTWSIATFQDTILYATNENKVIKVIFPSTSESEVQNRDTFPQAPEHESNKRRRLI